MQKDAGHSAWPSPGIFPFSAWIADRWRDSLYAGAGVPVLLNEEQEKAVWRQAIARSPEAADLLQLDAAAAAAREAWGLLHAWKLPQSKAHYDATPDSAAFCTWWRWYAAKCEQLRATDSARVLDLLRELIRNQGISVPSTVWLAGFDEFTPQQEAFLRTLEEAECDVVHSQSLELPSDNVELAACADAQSELAAAARWARSILKQSPGASIGVVIPKLSSFRASAERIFQAALHPSGGPGQSVHVSMGPALARHSPIHAALILFETFHEEIGLNEGSELLLSPYLAGAWEERPARSALDLKLRRDSGQLWKVSRLAAESCPVLAAAVRQALPDNRLAAMSEWCVRFSERLQAFGWPGTVALSSAEYQAVEAWNGLLARAATLDLVTPELDCGQALAILKRMAFDSSFQVEDPGCPVQILSVAEAAGSEWDHLWITGLDEDSWPSAAEPNPFLPLGLQRAHRVPHSSPRMERESASRALRRLIASGLEVVTSYSISEGEVTRGPSPLVAKLRKRAIGDLEAAWYAHPTILETLDDYTGPELPGGTPVYGGARTIQHQAACPFRAFAEFRLDAREMDEPDLGPDARKRGTLEHSALEHFWNTVGTLESLRALGPAELKRIAEDAANGALGSVKLPRDGFTSAWSVLEKVRLTNLLLQWTAVELERETNFTALVEQKKEIEIGGLRLRTRADRVDVLPDGSVVLIDYKGTAPKPVAWDGNRPDEPQLPLYAVTAEAPVAGVAFGNLAPGSFKLVGRSTSEKILPSAEIGGMASMVSEWRGVLENLASDFLGGRADVDPKEKKTCVFCHLHALCRIRD
jgi:probable DNA repair protein